MRHLALLPLVALAACAPAVPTPPPAVAAPPPPAPRPVVALSPDWRDWPATPGRWHYAAGPDGGAARFGTSGAGYLVELRCDRPSRRIVLAVAGVPGAPALTIRTSSSVRLVTTAAASHPDAPPPFTRDAMLAPADPLLDAMAFSRGHFTIEEAGRPPLVIPAQAEIGRVIEDCRD